MQVQIEPSFCTENVAKILSTYFKKSDQTIGCNNEIRELATKTEKLKASVRKQQRKWPVITGKSHYLQECYILYI